MTIDDLRRLIAPLARRVMLTVSRGVLNTVDDAGGLQRSQVTMLAGETREGVERVQPFGFSSVPLSGAEALIICVGGNRDHPVVVNVDDRRHRPTGLQAGEVCIYSPETGHRITLKAGRVIEIEGLTVVIKAEEKIRLESPIVELTGALVAADGMGALRVETPALHVTGEVMDRADTGGMTMQGMRDDYNAHHHGGAGPTPPMAP